MSTYIVHPGTGAYAIASECYLAEVTQGDGLDAMIHPDDEQVLAAPRKPLDLDLLSQFGVEKGDTEEGDLWVSAFGFDIHILKTDEGVVVDVWPKEDGVTDEPLVSTYAFIDEARRV